MGVYMGAGSSHHWLLMK